METNIRNKYKTAVMASGLLDKHFYNAFYENIEDNNAIDSSVELDPALYQSYTLALTEKLLKMPAGTRLVTYWGEWVPEGYELVYTNGNDSLRFWEKG